MNNSVKAPEGQRPGLFSAGEHSEDSRMLQLTELVGQIAQTLQRFTESVPMHQPDTSGEDIASIYAGQNRSVRLNPDFAGSGDRTVRAPRAHQPDPRLVRQIIRKRQSRARYFDGALFADPAWDMLLELTAARAENVRISVTSLCIASGVPPTTALRWIEQMTKAGLFERIDDRTDRRRTFIALTDKTANAMARYFAELGTSPSLLV